MAALRPVEERDAKGNTIRVNASVTFKQDRDIRRIKGRHDFDLLPNPDYHRPITAQVQNGKILFFDGTPDSTETRRAAKELTVAQVREVAPYIIKELQARPMKVREPRPTVYEVRLAVIDGVEVPQAEDITDAGDGNSVIVTPKEPALTAEKTRANADPTEAAAAYVTAEL